MRRRFVAPILALFCLAVPAGASAHARSATVALDYRLVLDAATKELPGVAVSILDGDRDLRLGVHGSTVVVVLGELREPMLRVTPHGTWVNRDSPTAVGARLTSSGSGWKRIASGATFTWHEHRLAPPPYDGSKLGTVARFAIPATVDGRAVVIGGSFVRYRRPLFWPWAAGALVAGAALAFAMRVRPQLRASAAIVLGAVAGLAAVAGLVTFGVADAPNGRVAWVQLVLGVGIAAVVFGALVRSSGMRRVHLAGILGVAAGAVSLGSLGVFWHGVVISLLPGAFSRLLCALALTGGLAAAATSYVTSGESR